MRWQANCSGKCPGVLRTFFLGWAHSRRPWATACHRECSAIRLVPVPHLAVAPATPKFPLAAKSARRRKAYPPTRHPLVRRHPGSERNELYIAATASHIVGLPVADGQALLAELINFATQTQFVYRHRR